MDNIAGESSTTVPIHLRNTRGLHPFIRSTIPLSSLFVDGASRMDPDIITPHPNYDN